jgi:hypothetical protein
MIHACILASIYSLALQLLQAYEEASTESWPPVSANGAHGPKSQESMETSFFVSRQPA